MRTIVTTTIAMIAFASNSLLCRLALGGAAIDGASFTTVRLVSGAITLVIISKLMGKSRPDRDRGSWVSAAMLFAYAIAFSFAYLSLDAGTGALILFGAVQLTMILTALAAGERPHAVQWLGIVMALGGLVYLVSPGLSSPSPTGAALMTVSGVSWGVYTLRGRGARDPAVITTDNFVRSVPLVLLVSLISVVAFHETHLTVRGVVVAVVSGALASGVGYVIWYTALRGLTATRAATVQLTVPVLAALGGTVFLSETVTMRLALAAMLVLGGVGVSLAVKQRCV